MFYRESIVDFRCLNKKNCSENYKPTTMEDVTQLFFQLIAVSEIVFNRAADGRFAIKWNQNSKRIIVSLGLGCH